MTSSQALHQAIHARLSTVLPQRVGTEGLPPIVRVLKYEPGVLTPAKAPEVWSTLAEARPANPAEFGGANLSHTRGRRLLVGVTVAGPDPEVAEAALEGYADLILSVMLSDQTAGGQGKGVRWLGTAYGGNMSGNETLLFKQAILTFEITRWTGLGVD